MSRPGTIPSPSGSPITARNANSSNSSNSSSGLSGQVIAGSLTEHRHRNLNANSSASNANRREAHAKVTANFPKGSSPTASPRSSGNPLVARLAVAAKAKATADFAQTALAAGHRATARQAVGLQTLSGSDGPKVILLANSGEAGAGAMGYLQYNQFAIESNPAKFLFVLDNLPVNFNKDDLAQQQGQLPKFLLDRQELIRGLDASIETQMLNRLTSMEQRGKDLEKGKREAWANELKFFFMAAMEKDSLTDKNQAFPFAQKALDRIEAFLAKPSSKGFEKILLELGRFSSAYTISIKTQAYKRDDSGRLSAWSKRLADLADMNPGKTIVCISTTSNVLSATMHFEAETDENDDVIINQQTMEPTVRAPEHKTGLTTMLAQELAERGAGTVLPLAFSASSVKSFSFDGSAVKTDFSKGKTEACLTVPYEVFESRNWQALNEARVFARDLAKDLPQAANSSGVVVPDLTAKEYLDKMHGILVKADEATKKACAPALMELMQRLNDSKTIRTADIWKPLLALIYAMD